MPFSAKSWPEGEAKSSRETGVTMFRSLGSDFPLGSI
jgi:hypothetical protein